MTTTQIDLATSTPAEIDTVLFPLWADRWFHAEMIYTTRHRMAHSLFPHEDRRGSNLGDRLADWYGRPAKYDRQVDKLAKVAATLAEHDAGLATAKAAIEPIDVEYHRRGRWTRYVLVRGGHLHKQGCGTLRDTTPAYLLAEASGLTADEVVDRYDFTACTHCFPDAPVLTDAEKMARSGACTGAGKYVESNGLRYAKCPDCDYFGARTTRGLVRKHKAEKAAEQ